MAIFRSSHHKNQYYLPEWAARTLFILGLAALTLTLATCSPKLSLSSQLDAMHVLKVAITESETTYYHRGNRPAGFEYDLVRSFAEDLGLKVATIVVPNNLAAIEAVRTGQAHIAVGVGISQPRQKLVRFTKPYVKAKLDVVYHRGGQRPTGLAELQNLRLPAHSSLTDNLLAQHPKLVFESKKGASQEDLLTQVANNKPLSTIADAELVNIMRHYYPSLVVAFSLDHLDRKVAWAFPKTHSSDLYNKAQKWLDQAKEEDLIHVLRQRYFSHTKKLGFVDNQIFARQMQKQLPKWRPLFEKYGKKFSLDWRLLAAVSYQESHWNAYAVSPTGVRGLMMLTQPTAADLGVDNRLDPEQSVRGGAEYIYQQYRRLPKSIKDPDRVWMTLAAYNMGYDHLIDARRLLKRYGRNPDLWINVNEALIWLTKPKYYQHTRYGRARGYQAKHYVENIRAYYDLLVWNFNIEKTEQAAHKPQQTETDSKQKALISITSPAL